MAEPLLEIDRLKTYFPVKSGFMNRTTGHVRAVDDISFTIRQGKPSVWWANREAAKAR